MDVRPKLSALHGDLLVFFNSLFLQLMASFQISWIQKIQWYKRRSLWGIPVVRKSSNPGNPVAQKRSLWEFQWCKKPGIQKFQRRKSVSFGNSSGTKKLGRRVGLTYSTSNRCNPFGAHPNLRSNIAQETASHQND